MSESSGLFAIILVRGHRWQNGIPLEKQDIGPHRAYLCGLAEQGLVLAAGPFSSADGGLILVRTADTSQALRIMHDDPAVRNGLFSGTLHSWSALIDPRGRLAE